MKISPSPLVDISRFERPESDLEVLYGLPRDVQFCKKCNMSNQQPMSSNEYAHSKSSKKTTISFDDKGICHACNFNELKETGEIGRVIQEVSRDSQVKITMPHAPSLTNQLLVCYNLQHIFFAEEPVLMRLTSPWFHKSPHMQYGSLIPGNYDIGRWFRPINFEYNLWDGGTKLEIEAGEPLAYIEFGTDRKIVLKRFEATEKLHTIGGEIIHARSKRWKTLASRYELFDRSPMRKIILKEITENLL